jgi:surface antigen
MPAGTMAPFGTFRNSYAWGQCTWYAASRRQIPANWGNANTWYYRALGSGWKVGTTPAVAAVAWTGAGYYGHVALVEQVSADGRQVLVSEMNYRGIGIRSSRWAPASSFRYIY